jgi:uncharacterized membrane protein
MNPMTTHVQLLASLGDVTLMALVFHFLPGWTRPDIVFAVTVDRGFRANAAGRGIVRRYRRWIWAHSLVSVALALTGAQTGRTWLFSAGLAYQIAGALAAFLLARRRTLPHAVLPSAGRDAALAPRSDRLPGGWPAQLGPFALLAAAAATLAARWRAIPARFPVHWTAELQPNGWSTRSVAGVFGPLLAAALACAALALVAVGVVRWSRRIDLEPVLAAREAAFRRATAQIVLGAEFLAAGIVAAVALLPLTRGAAALTAVVASTPALALGFVAVAVMLLVRTRTAAAPPNLVRPAAAVAPVGDRSPDACWKAGVFYFNHDDSAIFVEKRFGLGYTLNFGNPWSWAILAAVLIVPIAAVFLLRR